MKINIGLLNRIYCMQVAGIQAKMQTKQKFNVLLLGWTIFWTNKRMAMWNGTFSVYDEG